MALKIAYVGNFRPVHSTEQHIAKTLRSLGHTVMELQEDEYNTEAIYSRLATWETDIFLWTRTWGMQGDPQRLLVQMEERGIPTVSYHLDLYWGIARGQTIQTDPFWRTQFVFTPDGGHNRDFQAAGIQHHYIKPGVYKAECRYGQPQRELSYSVGFVGSEQYHPEWPYRPQLVSWLRQTYGSEFGKFGYPERTMRNQDLNNLYASARIIVGDSLCKDFKQEYYWSDRVYETLGRGGFLIHPYIKGMEEEFKDKEHLVFYEFGNFNQLKELIDYYLAHPLERELIRWAGHELVKNNYTYTERMQEMLAKIAMHQHNVKRALAL